MSKLLIVLVIFNIAGCSNEAMYEKFRLDPQEPVPALIEADGC